MEKEAKKTFSSFLYKAKLVLKTTYDRWPFRLPELILTVSFCFPPYRNKELMSDPEAVNLIYLQAVSDVVTSRYPANEKDVTVLAARWRQGKANADNNIEV